MMALWLVGWQRQERCQGELTLDVAQVNCR